MASLWLKSKRKHGKTKKATEKTLSEQTSRSRTDFHPRISQLRPGPPGWKQTTHLATATAQHTIPTGDKCGHLQIGSTFLDLDAFSNSKPNPQLWTQLVRPPITAGRSGILGGLCRCVDNQSLQVQASRPPPKKVIIIAMPRVLVIYILRN